MHSLFNIAFRKTQWSNVEDDPQEWNNLAGRPETAELERRLRGLILDRFDPDDIDLRAQRSYERRMVVRRSNELVGRPTWNYRPPMDVDRMYWRTED